MLATVCASMYMIPACHLIASDCPMICFGNKECHVRMLTCVIDRPTISFVVYQGVCGIKQNKSTDDDK